MHSTVRRGLTHGNVRVLLFCRLHHLGRIGCGLKRANLTRSEGTQSKITILIETRNAHLHDR